SCLLPFLVVVGVGGIVGRIGVGKKWLGLVVVEKFGYFGIVVEVVIVEINEDRRCSVPSNFPARFHPSDVLKFGRNKKLASRKSTPRITPLGSPPRLLASGFLKKVSKAGSPRTHSISFGPPREQGSKSSQTHVKPINPPPVQKKPAPYKPRDAKAAAAKEAKMRHNTFLLYSLKLNIMIIPLTAIICSSCLF
ncbi:hypothetical protein Tco_1129644, partial [Tanacetum coccineum]